jgi:signal transduction histidine kinase
MAPIRKPRGRLFRKYVVLIVILVSGALLTSGALEMYFSYQEHKEALVRLQREKALAAAAKIEQFLQEIERQIGWTTHPLLLTGPEALEQRRIEYFRLLRQTPAITEISQVDSAGKEQLRVSRLAVDAVGSQRDFAREPKFLEARGKKIHYSPVYFRKDSEPYITIAIAGSGKGAELTLAEVNLKFIWDVISQLKVGKAGHAYVVEVSGNLLAHPDISLVLQKTDLSVLPQVQAARARPALPGTARDEIAIGRDLQGRQVLTTRAVIAPLGWHIFLEQPLQEALAPLYASLLRTAVLMLVGLALSVLVSLVFARKLVTPIRALQTGAAQIGAGELGHRLAIRTGDEIEALADSFNQMATQLEESYANLEQKVEERTRELVETLEQQTATSELLRVIASSPTDLQPVLDAVAENAARLCEANDAQILRIEGDALRPVASYGPIPALLIGGDEGMPINRGSVTGRAVVDRHTIHVHDLATAPETEFPDGKAYQKRFGHRTTLATPLLREGVAVGALLIRRLEVRPFTEKQIQLLETFADQAAIAIENVRLFQELQARTHELTRSVAELQALGEVSQAVSSSLDLETVLTTIVTRAVQLSGTKGGVIYEYDEGMQLFHLRATHGVSEELLAVLKGARIRLGEGAMGKAAATQAPVQVSDMLDERGTVLPRVRPMLAQAGYRSLLAVPLLLEQQTFGGLVVYRPEPGDFATEVVNLLQTFATQSVLAIQNARLFREIEERGHQLEIASKHKSQFLANMSHELRTPLNAILGYTELILDDLYGAVPEKIRDVLGRVQQSGQHLLGLINAVLDLSKIEAGRLTLSLNDYAMQEVVHTVFTAVESLAAEKQLALKINMPPDLPPGRGDAQRLAQVLLNLVGNAIKFTDVGEVSVQVATEDGAFVVAVSDTGSGIAEADQQKIFEEFQQADISTTRKQGGTGLGLAIARKIIEMHGGRIWVESSLGKGSTFWFTVPVRVERQREVE